MLVGVVTIANLTSCASLKDTLIIGTASGLGIGAVVGSQAPGDHTEEALKGALIGGVASGLLSYGVFSLLAERDAKIRDKTLMDLEQFEVVGHDALSDSKSSKTLKENCFRAKEVDDREVLVPCKYLGGLNNLDFTNP